MPSVVGVSVCVSCLRGGFLAAFHKPINTMGALHVKLEEEKKAAF